MQRCGVFFCCFGLVFFGGVRAGLKWAACKSSTWELVSHLSLSLSPDCVCGYKVSQAEHQTALSRQGKNCCASDCVCSHLIGKITVSCRVEEGSSVFEAYVTTVQQHCDTWSQCQQQEVALLPAEHLAAVPAQCWAGSLGPLQQLCTAQAMQPRCATQEALTMSAGLLLNPHRDSSWKNQNQVILTNASTTRKKPQKPRALCCAYELRMRY